METRPETFISQLLDGTGHAASWEIKNLRSSNFRWNRSVGFVSQAVEAAAAHNQCSAAEKAVAQTVHREGSTLQSA